MSETAKRPAWNAWLSGRSDRKEYWAFVGIVVALSIAISLIPGAPTSTGSTGAMLIIQIRRFHDLGRTGWWAVGLTVAQFVVMLPVLLLAPEEIGLAVVGLIGIAVIVGMGAVPGDRYENRFGPPRGKRSLKEIFS
jgi:uncharacterized membrane protein YhaH (DUF805 family)